MKSFSLDLRLRIVDAYSTGGQTRQQIADRFAVSLAVVKKYIQQNRHTGSLAPLPRSGRKPLITGDDLERLRALVREQPDATLAELQERLGIPCNLSTIHNTLARMGEKVKKKTLHAEEQLREDVVLSRARWTTEALKLEAQTLVFLDETGAKTNMTRRYARAPKGKRACDHAPAGRWSTTTLIGAVRTTGPLAPLLLDGTTDRIAFTTWVEKCLTPTLLKGDIVIMDNLSSHKGDEVLRLIESTGARLVFLPPYSPDLNPIEKMWSKIKSFLRGAKARTKELLIDAVGAALNTVTPSDIKGWFRSCGYVV